MSKGWRRRPGKDIPVEEWASWYGTAYCFNCKKVTKVSISTYALTKVTTCSVCNNVMSNEFLSPKPLFLTTKTDEKINFVDPSFQPKGIDEENSIR
jgi:hypothetical protein